MIKIKYIILHHTGAEEKNTEHIKRNHLSRGWRDIGYNYIIERNGVLETGRSPAIPGAHCKADNMNFKSIGIALIGNFENHPPTKKQIDAAIKLIKSLLIKFNIPMKNILGHKEVIGAKTLCPGHFFPLEKFKSETSNIEKLYKVQVGAFRKLENAKKLQKSLKKHGFDSFIN